MNEQDALFAAVLEAPDDDAPRLVYADWLDENGQPERAEFIRTQIERARLPEDDPRAPALKARERELTSANRRVWWQELPAWARPEAVYRRGFAAEVRATAREFLKGAAGLFRRAPVRHVVLSSVGDAEAAALAASPHLARLSALHLPGDTLTAAGWRALLASPALANLTELLLGGSAFGPAEAQALASSANVAGLIRFTLYGGHVGDLGLNALATSPHLGRLTAL
ncbi:MAG TPA: TIGR02996 domain-containing protein, partial [Gemmataceae bacterium]|nr:TIGR02996 domain-containing protein [Gemmataceae bacterium]